MAAEWEARDVTRGVLLLIVADFLEGLDEAVFAFVIYGFVDLILLGINSV